MIYYHFSCRLLSDVILSSASATEGFHPSLEYIPGAKFWGIVAAALYKTADEQTRLDLFHNGRVSFGDAHLEISGIRSHKAPLTWLLDKHNNLVNQDGVFDTVLLHNQINSYEPLLKQGVQAEGVPAFYFTEAGFYEKPLQTFAIKSAYDTGLRRSEDEKMYGYYSLSAGSIWHFSVASESEELLEQVKKTLVGKKRIGRSRSAQYGLAEIAIHGEPFQEADKELAAGIYHLYADSALMLPLDLPLAEAFPDAKIDFAKSKIRTRIYQSWNNTRNTRDADRQVVEKGSVIVLELFRPMPASQLFTNLEERRAEGFGRMLINPAFLTETRDEYYLKLCLEKPKAIPEKEFAGYAHGKPDQPLLNLLQDRKTRHNEIQTIDLDVNKFINNKENKRIFRPVTASQWGTVRTFSKMYSGTELYKQLLNDGTDGQRKGYLVSGVAEEKWRTGKDLIRQILIEKNKSYEAHIFLEKMAAEMAKKKFTDENE